MADSNLLSAKIVANPQPSSWSQAYSAGKLFAVLSLEKEPQEGETGEKLAGVGKEVLTSLEKEFFTLETKDLNSIKDAISNTIQKIPAEIRPSFVISYIAGSVLYIFIYGKGKVTLKRENKVGEVLEGDQEGSIKSASGFLETDDVIILQTDQFSKVIPRSSLISSFDHEPPERIAETLSPHIHEREEGGASAVIVKFANGQAAVLPPLETEEELQAEEPKETVAEGASSLDSEESQEIDEPSPEIVTEDKTAPVKEETLEEAVKNLEEPEAESPNLISFDSETPENSVSSKKSFSIPSIPNIPIKIPSLSFNRRQRLYLTIGGIILAVLLISIIFTSFNKPSIDKELFSDVYTQAQTKYEEGQNLTSLNESLARESFLASEKILKDNLDKFPEGTTERGKMNSLLQNVESALSGTQEKTAVTPEEVSSSESDLLSTRIKNPTSSFFAQNDENVYFITSSNIVSVKKNNGAKENIIKNDKDWNSVGGLGAYLGNIYVLDKSSDSIIKFVAAEDGYGTTNYFASGVKPDLSKAVDITLDTSLYILYSDGRIEKYTRGTKDSFNLSGSGASLSTPKKIYTSTDLDNLYVLDPANSRIVVLGKDGAFKTQFQNNLLKNATDLDVDSAESNLYFLNSGKVYKISL